MTALTPVIALWQPYLSTVNGCRFVGFNVTNVLNDTPFIITAFYCLSTTITVDKAILWLTI
ncbi:hypothetical protein [Vibrio scophthalmi]|uniref:hypothetical protein n=1 Tax=Vibrio scophthalmi TaxID=45658 RepID=UPI00030A5EEF|nr:hypothetical protein [Vibrio scophthalmi]